MTAVPSPDGQSLSLVCDGCGRTVPDIESPVQQWRVVWAVVSRTGWGGSRNAIGPHICPQCDPVPAGHPDPGSGGPDRRGPGSGS